MNISGFGIANYRSFDDAGVFLENFGRINILIGRNNCGKSNVLRFLARFASKPTTFNPTLDFHAGNGIPPSIEVCWPVDELTDDGNIASALRQVGFVEFRCRVPIQGAIPLDTTPCPKLRYELLNTLRDFHNRGSRYTSRVQESKLWGDILKSLQNRVATSFSELLTSFIYVSDFRRAGIGENRDDNVFDGNSIIGALHEMQHPAAGQEPRQATFRRIETFVADLIGEPELRMEVTHDKTTLLLQIHGRRLPLESFGTGIHQLVLLCSVFASHDNHTICIEEPESHLHPELQRKFLNFIRTQTNSRYFISTHSNVFLDFAEDVKVYHVTFDGKGSRIAKAEADVESRRILTDMGYRASDLLQANAMIWLEGPSDRIFLNKWFSLLAPELIEGIHYSIAFYGGKVLSHFTASDSADEDLVKVLRINRHAIFVADRDGDDEASVLSEAKERVKGELGENQCWITDGREIENYLRPDLLKSFLSDHYHTTVDFRFTKNQKIQTAIDKATKGLAGSPIRYDRAKVFFARELVNRMTSADCDILDLKDRLLQIIGLLRGWNGISQ